MSLELSSGEVAADPVCTRAADGTITIDWRTADNEMPAGCWLRMSCELLRQMVAEHNDNRGHIAALKAALAKFEAAGAGVVEQQGAAQ